MLYSSLITLGLLACSRLAASHGVIVAATGDKGGKGTAIAIDPTTPRDGTDNDPFQQDTTVFDGDGEFTCGGTDQTDVNNIETGTAAVMGLSADGLPQVSQGGEVRITLHQVNGDGAGPYTCMISSDATGTNWVKMQVTKNVPGDDGNSDAEATNFPLVAAVAKDQTCTGKVGAQNGLCMVRCQNPRGPFGGCVPVQMVDYQKANAKVANPKVSETGGTNEDDVDAITGDDGGLFDKLRARKMKRGLRLAAKKAARQVRRAKRIAKERK